MLCDLLAWSDSGNAPLPIHKLVTAPAVQLSRYLNYDGCLKGLEKCVC